MLVRNSIHARRARFAASTRAGDKIARQGSSLAAARCIAGRAPFCAPRLSRIRAVLSTSSVNVVNLGMRCVVMVAAGLVLILLLLKEIHEAVIIVGWALVKRRHRRTFECIHDGHEFYLR